MSSEHTTTRGRASFERQAWTDAYAELSAADRDARLSVEDVERLAIAAHLIGKDVESEELLTRAHNEFLSAGQMQRAARAAFWLGFSLFAKGEMSRGGGWLSRARRLLDESQSDCVERGFLLVPQAAQTVHSDPAAAHAAFSEAAEIGARFHDADLLALGRLGQGETMILLGNLSGGVALLDEVMVAVTTGEISPLVTGLVYCAVIEACHGIFDLRRAHEWTSALSNWCAANPDVVPFRGQCQIRRAEIMRLHGDWDDAIGELVRARDRLSARGERAVSAAYYQLGELHRARGEFAEAEELYRRAAEHGRIPQPGLAQLRLAQGRTDAAQGAIRSALEEAPERRQRLALLPAFVEIMLAVDDIAAARTASDELSAVAEELHSVYLRAAAAYSRGAVLLAENDSRAALSALREACATWRDLSAPYEGARASVLLARACRAVGDPDAAELELDAAARAFESLGAAADAAQLKGLTQPESPPGPLTGRELEVLAQVARGQTNRAIAGQLGISEKTVARHVSNIFMKLGLSSRAGATAYAYQHHLV